jgi:hypothetical protein
MFDSFSHDVELAAAVTIVGYAIICIWSWLSWKKLKPSLFPDQGAAPAAKTPVSTDSIRSSDLLRMIRNWLAGQGSPAASRALAALTAIQGTERGGEAIDGVFKKAVETNDVASLLMGAGDAYTYVLAFPDRYENARSLGRYRGFADGWEAHLEALRDRIGAKNSAAQVVAFLFFLDPNGERSAVLLSFADKEGIVAPPVLRQRTGAAPNASNEENLSMEFRVAA